MAKKKDNLKVIDEAWLGLDDVDHDFFNPMSLLQGNQDDFNLRLTYLLTRPEYLSFICHHLLNIQILP